MHTHVRIQALQPPHVCSLYITTSHWYTATPHSYTTTSRHWYTATPCTTTSTHWYTTTPHTTTYTHWYTATPCTTTSTHWYTCSHLHTQLTCRKLNTDSPTQEYGCLVIVASKGPACDNQTAIVVEHIIPVPVPHSVLTSPA